MRKTVVQPARHAVPQSPQVFGVATTEILRCADVLRWSKTRKEVVVGRPEEWTITINRRLANHSRLVNVEVLEGVVDNSIRQLVAIVMTISTARATLCDLRGEDLFSAGNLCRLINRWKLGQRVRQQSSLILRPEDL